MSRSVSSFLESPNVEIHFAGFRSTTAQLQQCGWAFSAREFMDHSRGYDKRIQFIMNHSEGGLSLLTELFLMDVPNLYHKINNCAQVDFPPFNVIACSIGASAGVMMPIRSVSNHAVAFDMKPSDFFAMDARPSYKAIDLTKLNFEEFGIFKRMNDSASLYLPEKTCAALMKEILVKQAPVQKEIREKKRKEELRNGLVDTSKNENDKIKLQLIAV